MCCVDEMKQLKWKQIEFGKKKKKILHPVAVGASILSYF